MTANKVYLNGVEMHGSFPSNVIEKMSERVGRVVSAYFSRHPEEYEEFLKEQTERN